MGRPSSAQQICEALQTLTDSADTPAINFEQFVALLQLDSLVPAEITRISHVPVSSIVCEITESDGGVAEGAGGE